VKYLIILLLFMCSCSVDVGHWHELNKRCKGNGGAYNLVHFGSIYWGYCKDGSVVDNIKRRKL